MIARQWDGQNVRLEGTSYMTGAELDRMADLREDGEALAEYLGPGTCAAIQQEVGLRSDPVLDTIAPWRRLLYGLTIVAEPDD